MAKLLRNWALGSLVIAALGTTSARGAEGTAVSSRVRSTNPRIREMIEFALTRSPSFGDLLVTLDTLDRTIYVEEGTCQHREWRGCLQLMPTPGGRNVLIRIDPRQQTRAVVLQLAHELYHALEIASDPAVRDETALRALYERIGERSCADNAEDCFETRAAIAFEALVARQLAAATGNARRSR